MQIYQIDAFTDQPFSGNPAAISILEIFPADNLMQDLAAEINLSETAFVVPEDGDFRIRWFTPRYEVDLCGHATLAAAYLMRRLGHIDQSGEIRFRSRSGILKAGFEGDGVVLDFPREDAREVAVPAELSQALPAEILYCGKNRMDYLVEISDESMVQSLKPDFEILKKLDTRGVIVTAPSKKFDFVSRFFAPGAGIDEDPVTGSAHCCLAPYWESRLGQSRFSARQVSERGGTLRVELQGERVLLKGEAVLVFEMEYMG